MPVSRRTRELNNTAMGDVACPQCGWPFCDGDHSQDRAVASRLAQTIADNLRGRQWVVVGSNGHTYTVRQHAADGGWTCTCPAFGYGHGAPCKHINEIQVAECIMEEGGDHA